MHVVIMGSGGIGGYLGARLAAAGTDVSFIARGTHLRAMRETGLNVESALGDIHLEGVRATDKPATLKRADVVVFAVKLYDMEAAAQLIRPIVGPETVVVPFLNGVEAPAAIDTVLGENTSAGGVIRMSATLVEPGLIRHIGTFATVTMGALAQAQQTKLEAFQAALTEAGVDASLSDDITAEIWKKMAFLAPMSALTSLVRAPIGVVRADEKLADLYMEAVKEAVRIAWASGANLDADADKQVWKFTQNLPADMPSSMQIDLENERRLELDWLSGALVRMGKELNIKTPTHELVTTILGPRANGAI